VLDRDKIGKVWQLVVLVGVFKDRKGGCGDPLLVVSGWGKLISSAAVKVDSPYLSFGG